MMLAWFHRKSAGYPIGGSLEFARTIEQRYRELGGEIHYCSPVCKIIVEDDTALGIQLADGTEHRGDIVISAADGHTTIFDMLDGKYINDTIRGYYDTLPTFPSIVQVSLGVHRTFEGFPASIVYLLEKPIHIAGQERNYFGVVIGNFDPTLAPTGKTTLKTIFASDYGYWTNLHRDPARYAAEKNRIAEQFIEFLDQRWPGLARQVEMRDVATPITWQRFTGNWKGCMEGWMVTEKTFPPFRMNKILPGLNNFYMAGQWVEPGGGVPPAAMSGRNVVQIICKRDRKKFAATIP
jgi:phytoene dehydrogenase-like protein